MRFITANDIDIAYELTGSGDPLVLVHGGWSDHHNWLPVAGALAERFTVVTYDRRGHGRSERPAAHGTRRDQEDDLAALIEGLGLAPAHVAGTSHGGSIAIGLAARRPELVRSVVAHEPPLIPLVASDPALQPMLGEVLAAIGAVTERVLRGDEEGGARQFVEEVALGPGSWEMLPEPLRATMVDSAASFVAEQRDVVSQEVDVIGLAALEPPLLVTAGDESPPWFRPIVERVAALAGSARMHTYPGAGHAPHVSHPGRYLEAVSAFLAGSGAPARQAA